MSGSSAISSSFLCRIMRIIFCTVSDPWAPSITRVSRVAGAHQIDSFLGRRVLRPVDDVGPFDQLCQVRRVKSEAFPSHGRDVHGAGAETGVVHLAAAGVVPKVLRVLRRQECALMMIEPPGQARVGGVLEIHDGVHIAVEICPARTIGKPCAPARCSQKSAPGWNFASRNRLKNAAEAAPSKQWS